MLLGKDILILILKIIKKFRNPYKNTNTTYQLIWKEISTGVVSRSSLSSKRSIEIDNLNPGRVYKIKL